MLFQSRSGFSPRRDGGERSQGGVPDAGFNPVLGFLLAATVADGE